MAPPCPVLAGYRLVAPGPCACFPPKFVQEAACYSCVCRDLETLRLRFLVFHAGFSFGLSLQSEAGPCMIMGFIFLWPIFGFLYYLPRWLVVPAVMTQSCWTPFLGRPFYSFSQWPITSTVLFLFTHGLLCPFVFFFSFWASTARLLILLGFLGLFANSTLPWVLLLTSLGFPGPITLSLSLGFMGLP